MSDLPRRRQRPDSTKMWEESESRGSARDRDKPRDSRDHRRSSYRDRERERDRGGRRDEYRDGRGSDRNRDYRERNDERSDKRDGHRRDVPDRTRGELMPNALSQTVFALRGRSNSEQDETRHSRGIDEERSGRKGMFSSDLEKDGTFVLAIRTLSNKHQDNERSSGEKPNERTRSRSLRRDDERDYKEDRGSEKIRNSEYIDDAPQPVSFSIGASHTNAATAPDHDRMDVDGGNKKASRHKKKIEEEEEEEEDDDIVIEDDGMAAIQAMMGFGGFATTQNKQVAGNNVSAVRKEKKTQYRQYMNRVGGFNRPLSPSRD
ncbi:hypothetical protein BPOR_0250g00090 [Botrytis porri]|uniref:U4/U6.U5 small nuclear ribonucleoprotein 27kDa protein domain-containing protein n=1 Tax=Botrytis porri TaxID=87229 RepID=A0A4Z1KT91_9HELO|nr:hypothetical protein BPOR_0250g00090 [Botrytis porri]